MRVSVIIPTRGHTSAPLREALAALSRGYPPDAETIVVSDGGSLDLTAQLADVEGPLRLRCLHVPHGGPAHARNRGLEVARGEVVAFTDDDCRPEPGWVSAIAAGVGDSPPCAIGGVTVNGARDNPYADAAQVVLDLVARHEIACCGEVRFFPANNCAFPRAHLLRLGGFHEAYRTAEDRELLRRWRHAGHHMRQAPAAVVEHCASPTLPGFVRKFHAYGEGAARFHRSSPAGSYRDSTSFHLRIPALLGSELRGRPWHDAVRLVALLGVWELANTIGLLSGSLQRVVPPEPLPALREAP